MAILFRNKKEFDSKLDKIKLDGFDKLHIISDYDKTLTYALDNNKRMETIYAKIRNSGLMSKEYENKGNAIFKKYYPIEISTNHSLDEKKRAMEEWWNRFYKLGVEFKIYKTLFQEVIDRNPSKLREGVKELFKFSSDKQIPFLIFSAGMGDGITYVLKKENLNNSNVHVVSNFFKFNDDGIAIGFNEPLIHTFNKNETSVPKEYLNKIQHKTNVILLGDSLGDLNMAEGIEHNEIIKIGFLNYTENDEKYNDFIKPYLDGYDVIITEDSDINLLNNVLKTL